MLFKGILICYLFLLSPLVLADEQASRIGYAYDKASKELVYTESHFEDYRDGLIFKSNVIYKDPDENIIARKKADFSNSNFMPDFSLTNSKTGHKESARYVESEYEISFSKTSQQPEQDSRLSFPEQGVSDAGFDNFIIEHWEQIIVGEMFKRDFLIPSMMDFIKFRIYQDEVIEEGGKSLRLINIEPDSFIVRAFAGTTKLYYEESSPKLRRFDGVSNMRDKKGDNYKVVIQYQDNQQKIAKSMSD